MSEASEFWQQLPLLLTGGGIALGSTLLSQAIADYRARRATRQDRQEAADDAKAELGREHLRACYEEILQMQNHLGPNAAVGDGFLEVEAVNRLRSSAALVPDEETRTILDDFGWVMTNRPHFEHEIDGRFSTFADRALMNAAKEIVAAELRGDPLPEAAIERIRSYARYLEDLDRRH